MAKNLDISRGLIVAEAVMMGLAPQIGRQEAHDVVYDACRLANEKRITLADALSADPQSRPRSTRHHRGADLSGQLLGLAPDMVDRVLDSKATRRLSPAPMELDPLALCPFRRATPPANIPPSMTSSAPVI